MKGAVNGQCKAWWMMNVMVHYSMHPDVELSNQIWCTSSRLWKLYMVGDRYWGEEARSGKLRKTGYLYRRQVYTSMWCKLSTGSTEMWWTYFIHQSDNMYGSWSEIERSWICWMQKNIHSKYIFNANNDYMHWCIWLLRIQWWSVCHLGECQRFLVLQFWQSQGCIIKLLHSGSTDHLDK
jgi:hypothetical protein